MQKTIQLLTPVKPDAFLPISEVVRRARAEFQFVLIDESQGMRYLAKKLLSSNGNFSQQSMDKELAPLSSSVEMIIGDDRASDDRFLKCFVFPELPIEVIYMHAGQETICDDLLERLNRVLGYVCKPD